MKLKDKIALVTGGGQGIGAAIAERFVAEGARVCINDIRKERLEQESKKFSKGLVTTCVGDVSQHEDVKRMVGTTLAFGGKIDILVNNVGVVIHGPTVELSPEDWRRALDVNLTGPFLLMKEAIPHMVKNGGGAIINIASLNGLRCVPGTPSFSTSKAGLIMLTQHTALDYGPFKVRCNVICPGATMTPPAKAAVSEIAKAMAIDVDSVIARASSKVPLRRASEPAEIAAVCSFLASEDASFVTGAVIVVDGGANVVDSMAASMGDLPPPRPMQE